MDEPDTSPDDIDAFLLGFRTALVAVALVTFLISLGLVVAELLLDDDLVGPGPFLACAALIGIRYLLVTRRFRDRVRAAVLERAERAER